MKTAKTKINVDKCTLSVEFNNEVVEFSIFDVNEGDDDGGHPTKFD